ncbi:hypothetical protein [Streptomyces sp. NPDC008125]|uniref:hypothetical protein n=1 Tax=Streptomyces sp. NPDC008125 TaxID=3364811 RepID=UPI0036E82412
MTAPERGTLLVDARGRVGVFMGMGGPRYMLRPLGGGLEWEADPGVVRPATSTERLRAENARCNARSRGDVL